MENDTRKFEGPEKKLEIILFSPQKALRSDSDRRWNRVIGACKAEILSKVSSADIDAYLLSESSLFVWDDRILIITCGKTTLIHAVPEILKFVKKSNIAFVFYERKSFMFPKEQPSDFEDDVAFLLQHLQGKSYRLGPANDEHVHVFYSAHGNAYSDIDVTLQVLMHDLDPAVIGIFTSQDVQAEVEFQKLTDLPEIFSRMRTDCHVFSPYGFSINGILKNNYYTVHVTPNPDGSYVSFETNINRDG